MSLELFVIGILTVLVIAQNVYWAQVNHALINRLMCRDYAEYAHAKKIEKQRPEKLKPLPAFQEETIDPVAEKQAQELNSMLGMA